MLPPPTLADLSARLDTAEARALAAETRYARAEKRFRVLCGALFGAITLAVSLPFVSPAVAQGYGITLAQAGTRIAALETKTASISAITDPNTSQPTVRFTGVNVQVVNGMGTTNGTINGTGNIIIGYNERRNGADSEQGVSGADIRTGSHNLVVGLCNNYSSVGGVTFGFFNATNAPEACVVGGRENIASGDYSCVSGGSDNTASGFYSCISGGGFSTASSSYSSISGGVDNMASGDFASVSGGYYVRQINRYGFSAGGAYTAASPGAGTFHSP